MSQRKRNQDVEERPNRKNRDTAIEEENSEDEFVIEDPYEEEEIEEVDSEDELERNMVEAEDGRIHHKDLGLEDEDAQPTGPKQVWRPGTEPLAEGEELDYDPSAYIMYHTLTTEWPCLSFDFLKDNLGDNRQRFPLTMSFITGSQADRPEKNKLTLLKVSDLHKTYVDNNSDNESDDEMDTDPIIKHVHVPHHGGVNRIRAMPQVPGIVATLSDTGSTNIFDLRGTYHAISNNFSALPPQKPIFSFNNHGDEGYAIDWSPTTPGKLLTGDNTGKIYLFSPSNLASNSFSSQTQSLPAAPTPYWSVSSPFIGHKSSVEDLQWSPSEATVFASCSSDRTIAIWDTRMENRPQIMIKNAHESDVNVINWNKNIGYLLASGGDEGAFKVWDLRNLRQSVQAPTSPNLAPTCTPVPLAHFTYHKGPITSLEWAPHDESMIAVSSEDNQVSIWDLSVEADDTEGNENKDLENEFPPQLLFLHMGQNNIKEVHWHPQIPGTVVSTAEDSFNIFKPAITVSNA